MTAFLIDTDSMREHAKQGVIMIGEMAYQNELVGGFKSSILDNYTAVLMLKTAAYTGPETFLYKAFGGFRTELPAQEGESDWEAYCTYADGSQSPTSGFGYSRYWHGYTLPLRLLLCVLNVANIQMLLYAAQFGLILLVAWMMHRRGFSVLLPAFALSWFLMMPAAMGICIQYATASLTSLTACALLLSRKEKIEETIGLPAFFCMAGIVTNYVDLLTFPMAVLLFPLVLLFAFRMKEKRNAAALAREMIVLTVAWGAGYGGMWVFKWVLDVLIFGPHMISSILGQAMLRASAPAGESAARLDVLKINLAVLTDKAAYLFLMGLTGLAEVVYIMRRIMVKRRMDARAFVLLLPACLPIIWMLVMANHGFDHSFFTYRTLCGMIFALYAMPMLLADREEQ